MQVLRVTFDCGHTIESGQMAHIYTPAATGQGGQLFPPNIVERRARGLCPVCLRALELAQGNKSEVFFLKKERAQLMSGFFC